jgi:cytochrome c peroxidase
MSTSFRPLSNRVGGHRILGMMTSHKWRLTLASSSASQFRHTSLSSYPTGAAFDRFMEGDDDALSQDQLRGLLAFIKTPSSRGDAVRPPFSRKSVFSGVGRGGCVLCHSGPEFTEATYTAARRTRISAFPTVQLVDGRLVELKTVSAYFDQGYSNIGVRPTGEDIGRGASLGQPLSFTRAAKAQLAFAQSLPPCGRRRFPCPLGERDLLDGAFKIPSLRNVELTGPYFHSGGQGTTRTSARVLPSSRRLRGYECCKYELKDGIH